jgi:hypothetical protein
MPEFFNYQGKLTDSQGAPIEGTKIITFRIYEEEDAPLPLWTDTYEVVIKQGVFSVKLGPFNLEEMDFKKAYWLEVQLEDADPFPRQLILSTPYSFRAQSAKLADKAATAEKLGEKSAEDFADADHEHPQYVLETNLKTEDGGVNEENDPVDWTKLKNVPEGLADGQDDAGSGDGHSLDASDGDPTDVVYVNPEGKVGVGTISPRSSLEVTGEGEELLRITNRQVNDRGWSLRHLSGNILAITDNRFPTPFPRLLLEGALNPFEHRIILPAWYDPILVFETQQEAYRWIGQIDFSLAGTPFVRIRAENRDRRNAELRIFQSRRTPDDNRELHEALTLNYRGYLGIYAPHPQQRLHVNGGACKTEGGTTWMVYSDQRLKKIEKPFLRGLAALEKLTPVYYQYRPDTSLDLPAGKEHIGLIGQEVEKVIPEAVEKLPDGYLVLKADPVLWTMLNAIKELKKENEKMKAEIEELKRKLAR